MNNTISQAITSDVLEKVAYLTAKQEILECLTRISRGIDRSDRDLFLSGYHPDALIDAGAFVSPPDQVFDGARTGHEHGQSATLHNLLNHSCDLDGDIAHCETYFFFSGVNRDETNWVGGGRYLDRLEWRDQEWRIAFRYTIMEWSGFIDPVTVPLFDDIPDLRMNGTPGRNREDPSYRRPLANRRELRQPDSMEKLGEPS